MCSALTTVPCGCVGRREEGKTGCEGRRGGRDSWLMSASFLVTAFRCDQNKHRTSEAQGQLPTELQRLFFWQFVHFLLFSLSGSESNTLRKQMDRRVGRDWMTCRQATADRPRFRAQGAPGVRSLGMVVRCSQQKGTR